MTGKIVLLTFLTLLLAGICYGARFNYTWRDAAGTLNITDSPPPDGTEIIDIRIIPIPEPPPATPRQQDEPPAPDTIRAGPEAEAAALRDQESELRQRAADLVAEAEEQQRLAKKHHYKERYQRRAGIREREAEELILQAEALAGQAEALERQTAEPR